MTEDRDRPALVLVHGLGSAGTIWKSLIPQLLPHFSVVTVDLPGHGDAPIDSTDQVDPKSLAAAIVATVESELHYSEMHAAGNSLGGWIALEMGAVAPEKVLSITALAPAGLWHQGRKPHCSRHSPRRDARLSHPATSRKDADRLFRFYLLSV